MDVVYKAEDAGCGPLRQGIRQAYVPRVAVTPSHYSCAMNPPCCAI